MPHVRFRRARIAVVAAAGAITLAVTAGDPPIDAAAHHRGDRFQNNYVEFEPKGLGALLKWRIEAARAYRSRRNRRRRASTPTLPPCAPTPLPARRWGGYAIFAPDFQAFFVGDTAYSKDFADIHARFAARHGAGRGFDLALIPIGAYEPRWFMSAQHVDPAEAVQIHRDLGAGRSIGIHWGTFQLTDESLDEPPQALARAARQAGLADDAFTVMAVGATRRFSPRAP